MKYGFICLLLVSFVFSSCGHLFHNKRVKGDGNVVTQDRAVKKFETVHISSAIEAVLIPGSSRSVKVEIDSNLQSYIEVVDDGVSLRIRQRDNTSISPTRAKVFITSPVFHLLQVSGASKVTGMDTIHYSGELFLVEATGASKVNITVDAPMVNIEAHGASVVGLKGKTDQLNLWSYGASNIDALGLPAAKVHVLAGGASTTQVYPLSQLRGEADGACTILHKGDVASAINHDGATTVKRID